MSTYQLPNLPADAADPESMPEPDRLGHNSVFDLRYFSPVEAEPWRASRMWARPRGVLADDRVTWACVLTYLSDMGWAFYNALGNTGIVGRASITRSGSTDR